MTLHQGVTLASIVEREAAIPAEQPVIASVYLNRLAMGMRLQADPTVGYAIGGRPRTRLLFRDLRVDSPFNTYLYQGLPPGPICNPGRASIAGVIDPLPGLKELYFVADGTGRHIFSRSYEEHLARIRQVRTRVEIPPPPELAPQSPPATSKSAARVDTAVGAASKAGASARTPAVAAKKPATATVKKSTASAAKKSATVGAKRPDTTGTKTSAVTRKKPAPAAAKVVAGSP